MLSFFVKKLRFHLLKSQHITEEHSHAPRPKEALSTELSDNLKALKAILGESNDIVVREFSFGHNQNMNAALIFVDGLVNSEVINRSIIEPLMYKTGQLDLHCSMGKCSMQDIRQSMLSVGDVKNESILDKIVQGCLAGDAALLVHGCDDALIISCKGWEKRSINEPATESVIRGPREGFTENLRTNTALIRRKIKSPALTMETMTMGEKTKTLISLIYLKGVANPQLIDTIKDRLDKINTDAIFESGYIEQYIEDAPFSLFSTVGYSEKPDVVAAKLVEGRVAIVVDGTPFVLTAPFLFTESFQTAEDYYSRPFYMTLLRWLRYMAFFITILAPALYVAITTFHQELIPTELLFTMAAAREGIPFPAIVEALIMLVAFEILRESGVRLPRPVGQAISIVGALVMGDAAVSAGLIGAPMVIVIAITTVAIFAVPNQADAAALLRFILLILAGTMGGVGITIGLLGILVHVSSVKSFGFPYLAPIAPFHSSDLKDSIVRAPLWMMLSRPKGMSKNDTKRQKFMIPTLTDKQDEDSNQ